MNNLDSTGTPRIYTVSQITGLIKAALEEAFPPVWVEGEVSDFKQAYSGHLYFNLKDEDCQLRAVMWRSAAQKLAFEMKNGLKVICRGDIQVYEARGQYQIMVRRVEPKGKGALQLAFEQLKEKLAREGLFDPARKKPLPLLPKTIGVVTSPKGAALIDILQTLDRRFAKLHILIYPARVQGEGAAQEIVEAIEYLGGLHDLDVLIVGRGGGSIEDLWAFNMESVARAIAACPVPVISAVGHEIDFTIADFVADIRASTPSAAAELVIEKEEAFREKITGLENRLLQGQKWAFQRRRDEVNRLLHHQAFRSFKDRLYGLMQRVDELEERARERMRTLHRKVLENQSRTLVLEERLTRLMNLKIQSLKAKWERYAAELDTLSPLGIMRKGYTVCWSKSPRRFLKRIEDVRIEDTLDISFIKGEFSCRVTEVNPAKTVLSSLENDSGNSGDEV